MSLPSKVTPYKKSTISKYPVILSMVKQEAMSPAELYMLIHAQVSGITEYIEILDDPRVISYKTLYEECRKNLQTLTEDELLSIEELMNSLDKDVQLMGAMMIAKSNLELNDKLCHKASVILLNSDINLTKELKAFINGY